MQLVNPVLVDYTERHGKDDVILRPSFRRLLTNQRVHEGETAKFEIRVTGQPQPELIW